MKRYCFFIVLALLFLFSSCEDEQKIGGDLRSRDTVSVSDSATESLSEVPVPNPEITVYNARYVRTYWEDRNYPMLKSIFSYSELMEYDRLNESDKEEYDESFFEENILLMAIVSEGSGSNRHELIGIGNDGVVYIKRILPQCGTCDMAEWHIIIEIPRERAMGQNFELRLYSCNKMQAEYSYGFAHISTDLPKGFGYEKVPFKGGDSFGIEFYPLEDPTFRLQFFYNYEMIGFGGEGIIVENAEYGKYDVTSYESSQWKMFVYNNLPGVYILWAKGGGELLEKYSEEIEMILSTAQLSLSGIIGENRALELAKAACNVDYIHAFPKFDLVTGHWYVDFVKNIAEGSVQTVVIAPDGRVIVK